MEKPNREPDFTVSFESDDDDDTQTESFWIEEGINSTTWKKTRKESLFNVKFEKDKAYFKSFYQEDVDECWTNFTDQFDEDIVQKIFEAWALFELEKDILK